MHLQKGQEGWGIQYQKKKKNIHKTETDPQSIVVAKGRCGEEEGLGVIDANWKRDREKNGVCSESSNAKESKLAYKIQNKEHIK